MSTRSYYFNENRSEYDVIDTETKEDGKKFIVARFTMDWYTGKTNIPAVPRKEKPKG